MKKFIVKHWIASSWIMGIVVLITLLLLCGEAQACDSGIDTTNWGTDITDTTDWALYFLPAIDTLFSDRRRHPERWYIESVDTVSVWPTCTGEHLDTIGRIVTHLSKKTIIIDTTWAEKIPPPGIWLTPKELDNWSKDLLRGLELR